MVFPKTNSQWDFFCGEFTHSTFCLIVEPLGECRQEVCFLRGTALARGMLTKEGTPLHINDLELLADIRARTAFSPSIYNVEACALQTLLLA